MPSALEDGIGVSAQTSRRLACDASRVVMTHAHDGTVLDVGRKTRTVPPAIRRALTARDRRCRFPGCDAYHCDAQIHKPVSVHTLRHSFAMHLMREQAVAYCGRWARRFLRRQSSNEPLADGAACYDRLYLT